MKNLNEIVENTIYDIDVVENSLLDYKEKMKKTVLSLNDVLKDTKWNICYGEMINEDNKDVVFLTIKEEVFN